MTGAVVCFHGPVSRALLRRLGGGWLRRLRHVSAGTVAAGAVYVAAATEPNLSGAWVMIGDDGGLIPITIHHVGSRVVAEGAGGEGFDVAWLSDREFRGRKVLFWERDFAGQCPSPEDPRARVVVSEKYDVITVYWKGPRVDENCRMTGSVRDQSVYRRIRN